jgi:hypothetical protein
MHDFPDLASSYSTAMALSHDAQIELALAEIGEEIAPNYTYYAEKHELVLSTLSQRHRGVTTSRKEAISKHH